MTSIITDDIKKQEFDPVLSAEEKAMEAEQKKKLRDNDKQRAVNMQIDLTKYQIPYYDWTLKFRKVIEGHQNIIEFFPLMQDYYKDDWFRKVAVWARQRGKTTDGGGRLAHMGTQMNTKGLYITFSDQALNNFSNDKFRNSILSPSNPELFEIVKGADSGKGSIHRVEYFTGSSTSLVTHANNMHHAEGQSADLIVLDECQNLNLAAYFKAKEAQSWTFGKELFIGIGGYLNTEWHKLWLSSDQRHWHYDNPDWYEEMVANPIFWNDKGFVWRSELLDLLKGKWIATAPQNNDTHGYTINQDLFPNVPRTKKLARDKYKVSITQSLEYKKEEYPSIFYRMNVDAGWVKGDTIPFSKDAIFKLFDKSLSFTRPQDIDHDKGRIYAMADWGGGSKAFTVPLIAQCIHKTAPIFKVLYVDRMDETDVEKQADRFINLCNAYEVDRIFVDNGGGARQVQKVVKTFATRCTPISYTERPTPPLPTEQEMDKLTRENRFFIDRTYSIQRLKDLVDKPYLQDNYAFPRIIIPGADFEKVSWLADDFAAIQGTMIKITKTGQDYIRYDNPDAPDDAAHAFNYMWIGQMLDSGMPIWIRTF